MYTFWGTFYTVFNVERVVIMVDCGSGLGRKGQKRAIRWEDMVLQGLKSIRLSIRKWMSWKARFGQELVLEYKIWDVKFHEMWSLNQKKLMSYRVKKKKKVRGQDTSGWLPSPPVDNWSHSGQSWGKEQRRPMSRLQRLVNVGKSQRSGKWHS